MAGKTAPAPWRQSLPDELLIIDASGADVAVVALDEDGDYGDREIAIAHLIAAAPQMLEELKRAHKELCDWVPSDQRGYVAGKIREAIAAAEGDSA